MKNKLLTLITLLFMGLLFTATVNRPVSAVAAPPSNDMRCGSHWLQVAPNTTGAPGSTQVVAIMTVPSFLQGKTVTVLANSTNDTTNHPGSNVIVNYGADSFTLSDVESSNNKVVYGSSQFTLGATGTEVDMSIQFGSNGAYEAINILTVEATCNVTSTLVCGVNDIVVPYSAIYGPNGYVTNLAKLTVPSNLQGLSVSTTTTITNNNSHHPNSNIIVSSNSTNYTLNDVEAVDNLVTTKTGQLTLGSTVDMDVQIGSDQVFSAGGELRLTVVCPTGGQGGGTVVPPPQVQPTPTPQVQPTPPPQVQQTSTPQPQPTTPTAQVKQTPIIVNAGAGGASAINPAAVAGFSASLAMLGMGLRRFGQRIS